MKNRIWMVLLLVSLGVNIGFLLHWFWPKNVAGRSLLSARSQSGWHASSMRHGLGLDARQVQLMEKERRQVMGQVKPLQDELRLKRRELFLLLKNKTVAEVELDTALNEISRLQAAIEKMFVLHSVKVKGFFTPQQLQKYDGFFEQGLCPGMMSEKNCLSGKSAPAETSVPDCEKTCDAKK